MKHLDMNSPQPTPPSSRELFFRLADRLQLESCLQAIEQEGKSVVLSSTSPGLLDHYGQLLVQKLRQRLPQTPTEVFFPTHTEALIARFNEMLENVSIDDATQSDGPTPPGKLWIVHDASALPEHELKLLARLLQHLPGARVSAVLMLNGQAEALRNLDPQGRRLMRWVMEPPSQEQIEQLVQEARQMGREFAALELVARLAPSTPPPLPPLHAPAAAAPAPATPPASTTAQSAEPQKPRRRLAPVLVLLGALLLLSVGVAAWLNPTALRQLGLQAGAPAPAPAPQASEPAPQASEPAPAPATESSAPAPAETPTPAAAASAPAAAASVPAAATTPAATAAAPTPASATAPAPQAGATETTAGAKSDWVTEWPELAQRGLLWLRQLDKDTWVIEHGRHGSVQAARKQQAADKLLANARIVPVARQGSETAEFLVVTGPFRTQDRARNFMARNELGRQAKPHATSALLALTPAVHEPVRRP